MHIDNICDVFNYVSDYPCVISGNTVLLMDPQRPKDEVNATLKINEIHEIEGIDTSDILRAVGGKYGFDETVIKNGYFRGTMFWFPLRENASSISENLYNISKVEQLFGSLHAESSSILIFLKSLMCLHLLKMTPSGYEDHVLIVQIQDEEEIRLKRKSFFSCFKSASLKNDVACVFKMTIKETTHESTQFTQWLVITYYIVNNASNDFRRLIQSPKLGLSPCVGVAAKMQPLSAVEGHIFCFLPSSKGRNKTYRLTFSCQWFLRSKPEQTPFEVGN
ncbi:hypothetical protein DPMN_154865 [Dreissena polymorpha]|uniref:Sacsin/Nov domain-containing protein n=1 Tax=Dreissena polymorpha TaxID=45954 RepID=A0A9D4FLV9_DREPO|nr:hypothetical protein DPMN_154865 [Dreissena polymorpha]